MRIQSSFLSIAAVLVSIFFGAQAYAHCTTIQDGVIIDSEGDLVLPGYDDWGYNYQAHMFNGKYCDAYRDASWCQAYSDVDLMMKWNDAWISNKDCTGDGKLDRHFGYTTYEDSGAWLTNHMSGKVDVGNGKMRKWTYFVKIVAVNSTDELRDDGFYYTNDGVQIGPEIWGGFAIVQEISNDPSNGEHGVLYKSPVGPGLGSGHIQE